MATQNHTTTNNAAMHAERLSAAVREIYEIDALVSVLGLIDECQGARSTLLDDANLSSFCGAITSKLQPLYEIIGNAAEAAREPMATVSDAAVGKNASEDDCNNAQNNDVIDDANTAACELDALTDLLQQAAESDWQPFDETLPTLARMMVERNQIIRRALNTTTANHDALDPAPRARELMENAGDPLQPRCAESREAVGLADQVHDQIGAASELLDSHSLDDADMEPLRRAAAHSVEALIAIKESIHSLDKSPTPEDAADMSCETAAA